MKRSETERGVSRFLHIYFRFCRFIFRFLCPCYFDMQIQRTGFTITVFIIQLRAMRCTLDDYNNKIEKGSELLSKWQSDYIAKEGQLEVCFIAPFIPYLVKF